VRKAGVINLIKLIEFGIVAQPSLLKNLKELLPAIKTCLSDDWAPDLRFQTCVLCERLLSSVRE